MTQKAMSALFDCSPDNIGLHLRNIFKDGELNKSSVTEKYSATASNGKNYMTNFHNLDAVIDVSIAKNYLKGNELDDLGHIANAFLNLAESRAKRHM